MRRRSSIDSTHRSSPQESQWPWGVGTQRLLVGVGWLLWSSHSRRRMVVDLKVVTGMLQMHPLRRATEVSLRFYALPPRRRSLIESEGTRLPAHTIQLRLVNRLMYTKTTKISRETRRCSKITSNRHAFLRKLRRTTPGPHALAARLAAFLKAYRRVADAGPFVETSPLSSCLRKISGSKQPCTKPSKAAKRAVCPLAQRSSQLKASCSARVIICASRRAVLHYTCVQISASGAQLRSV